MYICKSSSTLVDLYLFPQIQAYAISAIAYWDWPEAWPHLFGNLMQALTSGDGNLVHGAMRVLTGMKNCTSLKLIRGEGTATGKWNLLKWCNPSNLFE